jgi:hypothetical protein
MARKRRTDQDYNIVSTYRSKDNGATRSAIMTKSAHPPFFQPVSVWWGVAMCLVFNSLTLRQFVLSNHFGCMSNANYMMTEVSSRRGDLPHRAAFFSGGLVNEHFGVPILDHRENGLLRDKSVFTFPTKTSALFS